MTRTNYSPLRHAQLRPSQYVGPHGRGGSARGSIRLGITKVALDMEGLVTSVLWEEIGSEAAADMLREAVVSVRAVVYAIRNGHTVVAIFPGAATELPERRFVIVERGGKGATIVLEGPPTPGRNMNDLYMLFLEGVGACRCAPALQAH